MDDIKYRIKENIKKFGCKIRENKKSLIIIYLIGLTGNILFFTFPSSNEFVIFKSNLEINIAFTLFFSICLSFSFHVIFLISHIITYAILFPLILVFTYPFVFIYNRYNKSDDKTSDFEKNLAKILEKEKKSGNETFLDNHYRNSLRSEDFLKQFAFSLYFVISCIISSLQLISSINSELEVHVPSIAVGLLFIIFVYIPFYFAFMVNDIKLYNSGWFVKKIKYGTTKHLGPDYDIDVKGTLFSWRFILVTGFSIIVWTFEYLRTNNIILLIVENSSTIGLGFIIFSVLMFESLLIFLFFGRVEE